MAGRGVGGRREGVADCATTATSGAIAWPGSAARREATAMEAGIPAKDDGVVHRRCQGTMAYLKNLADELDARGLITRVSRARSGVAFVRVVNPLATAMHEHVTCAPSPAGLHDWYYWWSWGECMHCVDDPAGAASKVARVLDTAPAAAG